CVKAFHFSYCKNLLKYSHNFLKLVNVPPTQRDTQKGSAVSMATYIAPQNKSKSLLTNIILPRLETTDSNIRTTPRSISKVGIKFKKTKSSFFAYKNQKEVPFISFTKPPKLILWKINCAYV